jgi:peroxiredoxin
MKNKILIVSALLMLVLVSARAAGTNDAGTELKDLVAKIQTKLQAGQHTAADLAPELKEFDTLLAAHQGEKTEAVARILFMQATLYSEVLDDNAKADALMKQLKTDFKDTKLVADIQGMEAQKAESAKLQAGLVAGAMFPDFDEKDVNGNPISVARLKGKVVLVDFWATWCPPCRAELPNVVATYNQFHDQGFEIIGVSLDESKAKLLAFTKENGMPWPEYCDELRWGSKLAAKYGVESIPFSILIDGQGKIIAKELRGDDLKAAVAKAVGK